MNSRELLEFYMSLIEKIDSGIERHIMLKNLDKDLKELYFEIEKTLRIYNSDWILEKIYQAFEHLEINENMDNFDPEPDPYNNNLSEWLKYEGAIEFCNEVMKDIGEKYNDIFRIIELGQIAAIERINSLCYDFYLKEIER